MKYLLGDYIRDKRLERNMSLREFARLCDLSHTHLDSIEKGYDSRTGKEINITNDTLCKLSKALGVDESYLLNLSLGKEDDSKSLDDVYLSFAKQAQSEGILPEDIKAAIEIIKKFKGR